MEKILFLSPYILSAIISAWITLYAWRHRDVQGANFYATYAASQSLWIFGYILELLSPNIESKIFWDSFQWVAGLAITIIFPIFAVRYTKIKIPHAKLLLRLSFLVPAFFLAALLTDKYHHLYYPDPYLNNTVPFAELTYNFTWIVYSYALYGYIVTFTGVGILVKHLFHANHLYRKQTATIILGFLLPIAFTVMTVLGVEFMPFRDVSPFTFAAGNLIISWGLFRYKLFTVVPIARDLVFDSIEDIVIVLDSQDRVIDLNATALRALGTTAEEALGKPVQKVYEAIPHVLEEFSKPENFHVQISLQLKHKLHHYDIRSTILHDKKGEFTGRVFVATDITDYIVMQDNLKSLNDQLEARVEQRTTELSRSMERYRAVVENQTEFIVRWKPDRTRTFVNEAYCHYFGLTQEEAMVVDFLSLVYEEDRPKVLEEISQQENSEKNANEKYIHRVIRADGTTGWNEWIDTPIRDKNGEIVEFQSVGRDITERIRTERALAHSEEKFYKAFNTTPVMMSLEDNKGHFIDVNQSFLDAFDFKKEEVIGRKASELSFMYSPDDLIALQKESQAKGSLKDFETRIQKKTGELGTILLSSDDFYMDGVKHTVTSGLDITDRKQAEEKLIEAYDTTLEGWAKALELRDKETEGHTRRVTTLTVKLAQACGIPPSEIDDIRRGAILHDIGKLAISDQILLNPGELTSNEWRVMSQHPWIGYKLLSPISFLEKALDIVLYHHERWDGTGYPKGLAGKEIPLSARIFAIVDVWDAVQSARPYKTAWTREKAINLIREGAGSHFDPQLTKIFLELVENGEIDHR